MLHGEAILRARDVMSHYEHIYTFWSAANIHINMLIENKSQIAEIHQAVWVTPTTPYSLYLECSRTAKSTF